jgi:Protein of unknown function (DUF2442)
MARLDEFELATERAKRRRKRIPSAISAHYDPISGRVVVGLSTDLDVRFSPHSVQGLENAKASQLEPIEITPSGSGLHFPKLDADVYLPALLQGVMGSKRWIAAQLGALGGKSKSVAKASASRNNGRLGGRPKKTAVKRKTRI